MCSHGYIGACGSSRSFTRKRLSKGNIVMAVRENPFSTRYNPPMIYQLKNENREAQKDNTFFGGSRVKESHTQQDTSRPQRQCGKQTNFYWSVLNLWDKKPKTQRGDAHTLWLHPLRYVLYIWVTPNRSHPRPPEEKKTKKQKNLLEMKPHKMSSGGKELKKTEWFTCCRRSVGCLVIGLDDQRESALKKVWVLL